MSAVSRILLSIQHLMSESSSLQERYGMQQTRTASLMNETRITSISKLRMEKFTQEFDALHIRMSQRQQGVSTSAKLRWIITDKEKFDKLLQELSHFVSRLNQLFPDTEQRHDQNILKFMATEDLAAIRDVNTLHVIRDATVSHEDLVVEAAEERFVQVCQQTVLDLIWFRNMDDRKDGVAPPHPRTFEWALNPPLDKMEWNNLSVWLQSRFGIYWLSGKAESGKSTLMKYIFNYEDIGLTIGSFFFWNLGTTEQRSQNGLSKAVLYQLLNADPSHIPILLPRLWQETLRGPKGELDPPSEAELIETVANNIQLQRYFSFFIDGLDEFVGNCLDGIMFVKELCRNSQIKVLVSSRPVPSCVDSFSSMPKLQLQDLTRTDISNYVQDTVGSHPHMMSLLASDPVDSNIILQQLINKAAGVFLWVVLACRSVLEGFTAYDRIQELCRRVDDLPPELEDLFQHMLDKVDPRYHEEMAKMLRTCYQRQITSGHLGEETSIYTIALGLFDSWGLNCENSGPLRTLSPSEQHAICAPMEGRLRSRCGGILELADNESPDSGFAILPKLEEITYLLPQAQLRSQKSQTKEPKQQKRDVILLLLAVESGLLNCTGYYLSKVGPILLEFPLLYHAIRKPMFWRQYDALSSQEVIRYLLSQQCHPNEVFKNKEGLTTTPWRDWLRELHRMDSNYVFATMAVTEEFIKGGVDPNPVGLETADDIIQRHLDKTEVSTAAGRQPVKRGTQLLDLIRCTKEQMINETAAQKASETCSSTDCYNNAGACQREEKRKRTLSDDDSLEARTKIAKKS